MATHSNDPEDGVCPACGGPLDATGECVNTDCSESLYYEDPEDPDDNDELVDDDSEEDDSPDANAPGF